MHAAASRARLRESNRGVEQAIAERTAALNESLADLSANEERLRLALEAGDMGTFTLDIGKRWAWCDERHERLFARKPDAAGHSLDEWVASIHPDDRGRVVALAQRTMQGLEHVLSAEYRIVWPDGSVHWLVLRGRVFFDAHGKPSRIIGVEQDIDERKSLEMELLQVADTEQRRIGQELHDDIQQRLTGLGLIAEKLSEQLERSAAPEHAMSRRLASGIGEACARVNRLSHGLVPLDLGGEGLGVALGRLARTTDTPGQLRCRCQAEEGLEIRDGFAATHLQRIAQEAVTNALKHSGANRITLSLRRVGALAVLAVSDNGGGITTQGGGGRGLRIMAYRASLIGATLKIARNKSRGTRVSVSVALPQGEPASRARTSDEPCP